MRLFDFVVFVGAGLLEGFGVDFDVALVVERCADFGAGAGVTLGEEG